MLYEVWVWVSDTSDDPDIMINEIAASPLEAVFAVMRGCRMSCAFAAQVFVGDMWVAGYCADELEVCL
jgi:hypothetical protein